MAKRKATATEPRRLVITVSESLWRGLQEFAASYQNHTEAARALLSEGLRERGHLKNNPPA